MKNRLATLAGGLALVAVLGKYYAVPAIAQTVRAALMQDRDNPARNYYQTYNLNCGYAASICIANMPAVPAGKRLIITHVSGAVDTTAAGSLYRVTLGPTGQSATAYLQFAPPNMTFNNLYEHTFNQEVFAGFDANQTPQLIVQVNDGSTFAWQATATGYMVDIP